ncbi:helix-turn-helix domain-containing protein [Paenibacillus sp. PCH8]
MGYNLVKAFRTRFYPTSGQRTQLQTILKLAEF